MTFVISSDTANNPAKLEQLARHFRRSIAQMNRQKKQSAEYRTYAALLDDALISAQASLARVEQWQAEYAERVAAGEQIEPVATVPIHSKQQKPVPSNSLARVSKSARPATRRTEVMG